MVHHLHHERTGLEERRHGRGSRAEFRVASRERSSALGGLQPTLCLLTAQLFCHSVRGILFTFQIWPI